MLRTTGNIVKMLGSMKQKVPVFFSGTQIRLSWKDKGPRDPSQKKKRSKLNKSKQEQKGKDGKVLSRLFWRVCVR